MSLMFLPKDAAYVYFLSTPCESHGPTSATSRGFLLYHVTIVVSKKKWPLFVLWSNSGIEHDILYMNNWIVNTLKWLCWLNDIVEIKDKVPQVIIWCVWIEFIHERKTKRWTATCSIKVTSSSGCITGWHRDGVFLITWGILVCAWCGGGAAVVRGPNGGGWTHLCASGGRNDDVSASVVGPRGSTSSALRTLLVCAVHLRL